MWVKGAVATAAVALSGCAGPAGSGGLSPPVAIESDSISYATSACFGRCPIYRVSVRPDGSGVFEGINFTAVTGERRFTITPEQYRAFAAHLEPLRPAPGGLADEECWIVVTDLPGAEVNWTRAIGDGQTLRLNYGCDQATYGAAIHRLRSAPDLLPIAAFIGPPTVINSIRR